MVDEKKKNETLGMGADMDIGKAVVLIQDTIDLFKKKIGDEKIEMRCWLSELSELSDFVEEIGKANGIVITKKKRNEEKARRLLLIECCESEREVVKLLDEKEQLKNCIRKKDILICVLIGIIIGSVIADIIKLRLGV